MALLLYIFSLQHFSISKWIKKVYVYFLKTIIYEVNMPFIANFSSLMRKKTDFQVAYNVQARH